MMRGIHRLTKLRAMPIREIVARGTYKAYTVAERVLHQRNRLAPPGRLRRALVGDLSRRDDWQQVLVRRERAGSFFGSVGDSGVIPTWFAAKFPDEFQKARDVAGAVEGGRIEFFGETFCFDGRIDWHADPVTRAQWPRTYHRDVPVGGGHRGFGDPKYVWELNRHQFLMDLGKVALLDGSERHRQVLQQMLLDWQQEVPYATGAAWACALEPAFRAWSWIWAYHFLRAAGPVEPEFHIQWLTGFYDHGRFLHRHLETYASPYNHLIGEASALFALGLLFPEFREAPAWVQRGRDVLESTVGSQFYEDGGTVEQSTFYHHATLGFYLLSALLGRRNAADLSRPVWHAIERGIDFSTALMQPDGRVPSIGGADDGKPIRLEHLPFWDFRPYYAIGAVLFERGDFKAAAQRFWEDAFWILGIDGAAAFDSLPACDAALSRTLPASGYSVFRSGMSKDADYLCFDCGPQAAGLRRDDVPSAAHGHADCLSVIATLGGRPVLVDPGFFCYNGETDWEVHFRRTAAHNTITIDGRDQARHVSKMAWTHTYAALLEGAASDEAIGWAQGSHDGYLDQGRGVTHRRTVWLRAGGYLVIRDEITGRPEHTARANFQFAPGSLSLDAATGIALFDNRFELVWNCSAPVTASAIVDGAAPCDGWIAPSLGVRQRAPRLLLQFPAAAPRVVLLTVLADRQQTTDAGPRVLRGAPIHRAGDFLLGATIRGAGWMDHVVARAGVLSMQFEGIETDAPVAVIRMSAGGIEDARRAGGTFLRVSEHASRPVFEDRMPSPAAVKR